MVASYLRAKDAKKFTVQKGNQFVEVSIVYVYRDRARFHGHVKRAWVLIALKLLYCPSYWRCGLLWKCMDLCSVLIIYW